MPARRLLPILLCLALLGLPGRAMAADVDKAPTRSFLITTTDGTYGVARQASTGRIYAVEGPSVSRSIKVYAGDATGTPSPLFSVPLIGCTNARFPAFNATGTQLVVSCQADGNVLRFSTGTGGDASTVQPLAPTLSNAVSPNGASFAPNGDIVVPNSTGSAMYVYKPDQAASPWFVVTSAGISVPTDTVVAPDGKIYVLSSGTNTVTVYPADSNGAMVPLRTMNLTGLSEVYSLALDNAGNVYASGFNGGVLVFPAGSGSSPLAHLSGPVSGLGGIESIVVDPERRLVVNELPGRVATFSPLVPFKVPGGVRSLKVGGAKTDRKREVTWSAPAQSDKPVTSYVVTVSKGAKTVLSKTVTATKLKLKRKKLPTGKLKVTVLARSSVGSGPRVTVTFKVKVPK